MEMIQGRKTLNSMANRLLCREYCHAFLVLKVSFTL